MAKRRRLEAPSAADLDKIEEEFRRETSNPDARRAAPIAQVARETAAALDFSDPGMHAAKGQDEEDAKRLREAEAKGLLMLDIPVDQIELDSMIRDRSMMDAEALTELRDSILKNGMRLPVEVYQLPDDAKGDSGAGQGARFGLMSGYRRLHVVKALHKEMGKGHFETIRAVLRTPATDADRFAAMVEENEVRQQLSHFERGRIAALSAQQGVFANTEAAVAALFPVASKAKRSKIRSFAMIFEELGDILEFPEALREKDGLRIASALRDGREGPLRECLEDLRPATAQEEWQLLEEALDGLEESTAKAARGGRPKAQPKTPGWHGDTRTLNNGIKLRKGSDSKGYVLHISGRSLPPDTLEQIVDRVAYLLEDPDG